MNHTKGADPFSCRKSLKTALGMVDYFDLPTLSIAGLGDITHLPYSIRVLLEQALRQIDGFSVTVDNVKAIAGWTPMAASRPEIPFKPARVLMQDFTGVPCVVDLAAMRDAMKQLGGDPRRINPLIPIDLVIDHSVQVDAFGRADALGINAEMEFQRNVQRYEFLRWGQNAFDHFRVVPPATGIVHQVNLEYLASVVTTRKENGKTVAFPDSLVGTDSHTTMINGLGVLGWGVGGIEAEANMLGQPYYMLLPDVVGFRLKGHLSEGATATDMVLWITQMLRAKGVVSKFVEFFGPGLDQLSVADRATIANMAPEYGATMGFFPVDDRTLDYLRMTARPAELIDLVERYCKAQGLFRTSASPDPVYTDLLELNLGDVEPSLAGPKRPQDRVSLSNMQGIWRKTIESGFGRPSGTTGKWSNDGGGNTAVAEAPAQVQIKIGKETSNLSDGSVVIAAITSCTNTSNPSVMVGAGLLAKKAVENGLKVKPHVKTSLAPGSKVVTRYLDDAGLTPFLDKLGFQTVGYGCTTCIGNSGPLPEAVEKAVQENGLVVAAVLSGNRNFEGRIHSTVKANYLASPPLVVAYALAGTVDIDLTRDPIGQGSDGKPVYLKDLWPKPEEVRATIAKHLTPEKFKAQYAEVFTGNERWNRIQAGDDPTYHWDVDNTYIQNPPFFEGLSPTMRDIRPIHHARVLALLGDSVTTDHISPAGSIKPDSPAGKYLQELGVAPKDFNSYGSRRGNDRVMTRGTFANVRLKNLLVPGVEGGFTAYHPTGEKTTLYEAAMRYKAEGVPTVILAGVEYGAGSSRDWAAKGTFLLGVKAVIAKSYERIHRSNLIGMGVLPLQFLPGQDAAALGLTGCEALDILGLHNDVTPGERIRVVAMDAKSGAEKTFEVFLRLDSPVEVFYYRNGGILQTVLRQLARGGV